MAGRQQQSKRSRRDLPEPDTQGNDFAITYFVPGDDIDAHVLVHYVGTWIDGAAKIRTGRSPDNTRVGFNITSESALNSIGFRDIVNDSRDWDNERKTNAYKRQPYPYAESDTADRRARHGPSKANVRKPEDNVDFQQIPQQSREYNPGYPSNPPPSNSPPTAPYSYQPGAASQRLPHHPQQVHYQQQQQHPIPQQQYTNYTTGGGSYAQSNPAFVRYEPLDSRSQAPEPHYGQFSIPTSTGEEPPPSYEQGRGPQGPSNPNPQPTQPSGGVFDDDKRSTQMRGGTGPYPGSSGGPKNPRNRG